MIPGAIPLVQSMCLSITMAKNLHRFRSLVLLGIAILNVIGTWILLHIWGVKGGALMTGIALLIGNGLILNWYYWKKIELNIPKFWREIGRVFIIPLIMCIAFLMAGVWINWYDLSTMLLGIIIFTVIYFILNWRLVMTDYEKELLISPLRRIVLKINKVNN